MRTNPFRLESNWSTSDPPLNMLLGFSIILETEGSSKFSSEFRAYLVCGGRTLLRRNASKKHYNQHRRDLHPTKRIVDLPLPFPAQAFMWYTSEIYSNIYRCVMASHTTLFRKVGRAVFFRSGCALDPRRQKNVWRTLRVLHISAKRWPNSRPVFYLNTT